MKQTKPQNNLIQQRITVVLALLFWFGFKSLCGSMCLLCRTPISKIEKQQQKAE